MSEWISARDRLPEKWKVVIVALSVGSKTEVHMGWYNGADWYIYTLGGTMKVSGATHWIRLPEPPAKQEELETLESEMFQRERDKPKEKGTREMIR